ncbi:MAG: B12-binding domain-containing radical SAM protein [Verrucomicrobiae bacterium]|nr:B12-binding domain-containing radical SAM protein [Verrucomicrobiae bacterium]
MIIPAYPAFNIYSRIARHTTALGPVSVATVVSHLEGWDVEVIDENNYWRLGPRDVAGMPDHGTLQTIRRADVAGLYGGLSSTIPRLHQIARFYRERGITTIAGGQHFVGDNIREALEQGVDFVVIGEGEDSLRDLLESLRAGRDPSGVAGIAFLRDGALVRTGDRTPITDFDRLPLPDFGLLRYARVRLFPVGWIRGCGMDCEFCTVKGRPRPASVERVVGQVASAVERYGARSFFLVDDLFGHRRTETLRLCRLLADYQKAIGIRLDITVQIRLERAKDTEMLQAMRSAGINTVCVGFESPIPEELDAMNKKLRPSDMVALTRGYHVAGFRVHGMFIFGYPVPAGVRLAASLQDRIRRFRSFVRKARIDTIQVLLPVPLPGTALTARLGAQNRIFPRDCVGWEYYDGNFPLFMPDAPLSPGDMQMALRRIMGRFYRFRTMFAVGLNVLTFPAMVFAPWDIPAAWHRWHRAWQNNIMRFGGWILLRRWTSAFKAGDFAERLALAERRIGAGWGFRSP